MQQDCGVAWNWMSLLVVTTVVLGVSATSPVSRITASLFSSVEWPWTTAGGPASHSSLYHAAALSTTAELFLDCSHVRPQSLL